MTFISVVHYVKGYFFLDTVYNYVAVLQTGQTFALKMMCLLTNCFVMLYFHHSLIFF